MAETTPPPELSKSFAQAKAQTQPVRLPESIKKDAPKKTFEMPGPLGAAMRQEKASMVFAKDHALSTATRAKNFTDKQKASPVISKENVKEGSQNLLGKTFNDKSRGLER